MINQEGGSNNVVDHCCGAGNFVAPGVGDQLHNGRVHSRHTGDCHYCCGSWLYSGAARVVKHSPLVPLRLGKRKVR